MYQKLKKLFASSSIYTLGNVVNRALFLISMPIMTRYLIPKEYGILSLINAVTAILATLYGLGTTSSAMRFYYEYDSEIDQKRLMGAILGYILLITFFVSAFLSISFILYAKLYAVSPLFFIMIGRDGSRYSRA